MFMRFIQLKINPQYINEFQKFYDDSVSTHLQKMPGCLFAGLIKSESEKNEFISLTFWETLAQAEYYEKEGVFQSLIKESKHFLSESTEWKIHLSDSMELQYGPVSEEPVIKKYSVWASIPFGKAQINVDDKLKTSSTNMFVRIVSAKIQEGKVEEFKKIYTNDIIPELKSVKGCKYVYLIESLNEKDEFISLTIWNNKEAADNYESSGKFADLVYKVRHTFSQFYLWKMALEKDYKAKVHTTEDLRIGHYDFVSGKAFE